MTSKTPIMRPELFFAVVALLYCAIAMLGLYSFFGPEGENLKIVGIAGTKQLMLFPLLSAGIAWWLARRLLPRASELSGGARFVRGALIGGLSFIGCILVQAAIVAIRADVRIAFELMVATILFGGLTIGLAGCLVSGLAAIFMPSTP